MKRTVRILNEAGIGVSLIEENGELLIIDQESLIFEEGPNKRVLDAKIDTLEEMLECIENDLHKYYPENDWATSWW
ncbi:MAG: hypothetical protein SVK08_02930 [Halobacteriota archaeon]|nr:hypothetical protein [Halobacteriota archaeon]